MGAIVVVTYLRKSEFWFKMVPNEEQRSNTVFNGEREKIYAGMKGIKERE